MARIKHIAIRTTDPEKTSAFYQEVFGLKKVGLGLNGIYLSVVTSTSPFLSVVLSESVEAVRLASNISASKWKTLNEP